MIACDYSDYKAPDLFRAKMQKAKKQHKCCECNEIINPGEMYENACGLWDDFMSYKTCEYCLEGWKILEAAGAVRVFEGLRDAWDDYWRDTRVKPVKPKPHDSDTVIMDIEGSEQHAR